MICVLIIFYFYALKIFARFDAFVSLATICLSFSVWDSHQLIANFISSEHGSNVENSQMIYPLLFTEEALHTSSSVLESLFPEYLCLNEWWSIITSFSFIFFHILWFFVQISPWAMILIFLHFEILILIFCVLVLFLTSDFIWSIFFPQTVLPLLFVILIFG